MIAETRTNRRNPLRQGMAVPNADQWHAGEVSDAQTVEDALPGSGGVYGELVSGYDAEQ
jgi:hypothetical protein